MKMSKRILSLTITLLIVLTSLTQLATVSFAEPTPVPTAMPTVSDISLHWARDYIQPLVGKGIIRGYPDGTFLPDNPISRAEFCTIITKSLVDDGVLTDFVTATGTFTDVPADLWSVKYIETAYASGFVGGKGPGIFDPEAYITRQEMAKIISLVYCAKNSADFNTLRDSFNAGNYNLSDLTTADDWAMSFIKVALVVVAMRGNEDGTFSPLGLVTRAETATVTFRILGLVLPTATPAVSVEPTATPTIAPTATATPEPTPIPTQGAIRSHGTMLTVASITRANYPDYVQDPPALMTILADGQANKLYNFITCNLDQPEYLFDYGSVQSIQSFAIAGAGTVEQALYFRLLISEDNESWSELGVDVPLKISQPIIEDKSIYVKENFDDLTNTGRMNPAPTKFDTTTTDEIFTIGNFQNRTLLDPNGNEIDVDCFSTPRMNNTIKSVDWQAYGFIDNDCNYLFHYFMDDVQSARYVKVIGYGNSMTLWYMWSSFSEVQAFGPDAAIAE